MPLRGLRRSPFTRPRKERRESKLRRSSWTRKSADSSSCPVRTVVTALLLVQRLEVLLDLPLEVARHLLPRDGFFHHLPVLPEHTHVLHARRHLGAAPEHVGIDALLAARPRLAFDAHVAGVAGPPRRRIALRRGALAPPREQALTLGEVALVAGPAGLLTRALVAAPATAPLALAPALQRLAVAAALLHGAHLVQRPLHRLHRLVALAALECLHALVDVARPVPRLALPAVLPAEPLHLAQQLAQLLGRDLLVGIEPASKRLRLLEDHAGLGLGAVALQVGTAVQLLQHAQPA